MKLAASLLKLTITIQNIMPIKPENKDKYPKNWKQISAEIRFVRARNRCEICGIGNNLIIKRFKDGTWRQACPQEIDMIFSRIKNCHSNFTESLKYHGFVKVILTVAHLDHTPENCSYDNLKAMCQKCHNSYDARHRRQTIRDSHQRGQLALEMK
jgi:hypothetical protein